MHDSPLIERIEWGKLTVAGGLVYRDAKLWPGGSCPWDWTVTGTRHVPGIQPADLADILARDVDVVVLSRGQELVLQTQPETFELLRSRGIVVVHAESREAVVRYNELAAAGRRVAALIHSTC